MTAAEKSPLPETPDPFAWEADPVVVVSRRSRIFMVPALLLSAAEVPEAKVRRWLEPETPSRERGDVEFHLNLGVTFLGAVTSKWHYRKADERQQPKAPPPVDACLMVEPQGKGALQRLAGHEFKDRETGRRRPDLVRAAWARCLAYLRHRDNPNAAYFTTPDGFDAPEVIVLPISQLLKQNTEAGRHAYAHALAGAARCKDLVHLGALHDYAFRERTAGAIVTACRSRALAVAEHRL